MVPIMKMNDWEKLKRTIDIKEKNEHNQLKFIIKNKSIISSKSLICFAPQSTGISFYSTPIFHTISRYTEFPILQQGRSEKANQKNPDSS